DPLHTYPLQHRFAYAAAAFNCARKLLAEGGAEAAAILAEFCVIYAASARTARVVAEAGSAVFAALRKLPARLLAFSSNSAGSLAGAKLPLLETRKKLPSNASQVKLSESSASDSVWQ